MENIFIYILVGFLAQMIDGTLGMAYGVSSTTFLLSAGVSPKIAGASVHIAEVFTTFVSGISHLGFKNINKALLTKLVIPGVLGGITGAYILINAPSEVIKPFVDIYLVIMGIIILVKAFKSIVQKELEGKKIWGLGLIGGFFDAIGGGGWGPIVTSTLVANGYNPRYAIGTVNLAEFFVTVSQAATFVTFLGFSPILEGHSRTCRGRGNSSADGILIMQKTSDESFNDTCRGYCCIFKFKKFNITAYISNWL